MSLTSLIFAAFMLMSAPTLADAAAAPCDDLRRALPDGDGPVFLPSYPTAEPGPLHGVAFVYDNAVAAIALTGCGAPKQGRRIGDALVWALNHDRAWHDGRLRNAYAAGPVGGGPVGGGPVGGGPFGGGPVGGDPVGGDPVRLGGWWDAGQNRWLEDAYQVGSDSGNMAWALLALLSLDPALEDGNYRTAALRIGSFLAARRDARGAGGFMGGFFGWEPQPATLAWKSTEHNTDLAAAFSLLAAATRDARWSDDAAEAGRFVQAMWDPSKDCFAVGTTDDGVTRNRIIALDAQLWPLLAIPGLAAAHGDAVFSTIGAVLRQGGGYGYSDAGPGLWTEGTAQAALVSGLTGRAPLALSLRATVAALRAPSGGYYATASASLPTGFADPSNPGTMRAYYHLPHLAATAWAALAEKSFNPFLGAPKLP